MCPTSGRCKTQMRTDEAGVPARRIDSEGWLVAGQSSAGPLSRLIRCTLHFRGGSKTVLAAPKRHFRSTPNNRHQQTGPVGPVGAISGSKRDIGRRGLLLQRLPVVGVCYLASVTRLRQLLSLSVLQRVHRFGSPFLKYLQNRV
jgi:hypothetical protein